MIVLEISRKLACMKQEKTMDSLDSAKKIATATVNYLFSSMKSENREIGGGGER